MRTGSPRHQPPHPNPSPPKGRGDETNRDGFGCAGLNKDPRQIKLLNKPIGNTKSRNGESTKKPMKMTSFCHFAFSCFRDSLREIRTIAVNYPGAITNQPRPPRRP
jgi:hypothetical protein